MYIEESFDTIFNMGYGTYASGKSLMLLRVKRVGYFMLSKNQNSKFYLHGWDPYSYLILQNYKTVVENVYVFSSVYIS